VTGPIQFCNRVGSPTFSAAIFSFSMAVSLSATVLSTYRRDKAEHFCPDNPKAERTMPLAARSRSAFAVTMQAFLPPISAMQGRG